MKVRSSNFPGKYLHHEPAIIVIDALTTTQTCAARCSAVRASCQKLVVRGTEVEASSADAGKYTNGITQLTERERERERERAIQEYCK